MLESQEKCDPHTAEQTNSIYRQMLDAAGVLFFVLNEQENVVQFSAATAEFLGFPAEELKGKSARLLLSDTALRQMQAVRNSAAPRTIHTVIRLARGQTVIRLTCQAETNEKGDLIHCLIDPHKPAPPRIDPLTGANSLYHLLARNLPETAVILFDRTLHIQIAEGQALQQFHLQQHALEGKHLSEILSSSRPETAHLLQQCENALTGQESYLEQRVNDLHFNVHVIPVRSENNAISGGLLVAQNVHARKESEQALQYSEGRNRALLDALPDNMLVVRHNGIITEIHSNPDMANLWLRGVASGDSLEQTGLPPEIVEEALYYVQEALNSGEIQSFAFTLNGDTNGDHDSVVHYEARMLALNTEEVLVLLRDITALKRIQDELRRHVEDLTIVRQVNVELADNLNFTYVAQLALDAALRLSKADSGFLALMRQDATLDLVHVIGAYEIKNVRAMLAQQDNIIAHVIQTQQPELIIDAAQQHQYAPALKDTRSIMVIPLVSNDRLVGILYLETRIARRFTQDRFPFLQLITGRIAAYLDNARLYYQTQEQLEQLQKLYAEVAQLEQLKTDMIRIASHDLKNPLSWVMGYLDFLQMDMSNLTPQQISYVENIEKSARKMQHLTTSILSLERIEHMAQEHTREQFNFSDLLNRCLMEQMEQVVRRQQTLARDLPAQPVLLVGDAIQLHEAITNLLANAIKYTPVQGTITVSMRQTEMQVQLRITDTGYGIPEELQTRLFTPFYRAVTQETRNIEGTGLGLHLVKNIIERHQGTLFFESAYGEGSTFGFDLPLHPPAADEALPGSLILDQ